MMSNAERLARMVIMYYTHSWDAVDYTKWKELCGASDISRASLEMKAREVMKEEMDKE